MPKRATKPKRKSTGRKPKRSKPGGTLTSVDQLKPAPYNPRTITVPAMDGLTRSIEAFGDVAGIVWNQTTKHLAAGYHRARALIAEHGVNLKCVQVGKNYCIVTPTKERFPVRVVHWTKKHEKAANIAATEYLVAGQLAVDIWEMGNDHDAKG